VLFKEIMMARSKYKRRTTSHTAVSAKHFLSLMARANGVMVNPGFVDSTKGVNVKLCLTC